MNHIETWQQGRFIDKTEYSRMGDMWKDDRRNEEAHLVRPSPEGNAICWCPEADKAAWIAQRLNLASRLEKMTYDFATGKTDGSEIVALVKDTVS